MSPQLHGTVAVVTGLGREIDQATALKRGGLLSKDPTVGGQN